MSQTNGAAQEPPARCGGCFSCLIDVGQCTGWPEDPSHHLAEDSTGGCEEPTREEIQEHYEGFSDDSPDKGPDHVQLFWDWKKKMQRLKPGSLACPYPYCGWVLPDLKTRFEHYEQKHPQHLTIKDARANVVRNLHCPFCQDRRFKAQYKLAAHQTYDKGDVLWIREPGEDEGHKNRDTRDNSEREDSDAPSETAAEVEDTDTDHDPGPSPADMLKISGRMSGSAANEWLIR